MDPISPSRLARRLGTVDAVVIGLASMIGAGIFAALGPAARAAGSGLLLGLVIAGAVAYLNATSSAQLAALYPRSGATYVYGRERLGEIWGAVAGWCFVVGKTASCAAMALTFGAYAFPRAARLAAVCAVIALTAIDLSGIRKSAGFARAIVIFVVGAIIVLVAALLGSGEADPERLTPLAGDGGFTGVLRAAGFLLFAFAGYARIATLGEEVRDPHRTIPRAVPVALGMVLALYAVVAAAVLLVLPIEEIADSPTALATAIRSVAEPFLPLVRVAAAVASLGVLLSLLAGVARTVFEMGSQRDLPRWLDAVHAKRKVPQRAQIMVAAVVIVIVALADIRSAIGFSSVTVLAYYAITNLAAITLERHQRRWPRWMAVLGFSSCIVVAASLPLGSVLSGLAVVLGGGAMFLTQRRLRGRGAGNRAA